MAISDKIFNGDSAKPSGYWGVANPAAIELDALIKDMSPEDLEMVLDKFCCREVK